MISIFHPKIRALVETNQLDNLLLAYELLGDKKELLAIWYHAYPHELFGTGLNEISYFEEFQNLIGPNNGRSDKTDLLKQEYEQYYIQSKTSAIIPE